MLQQLSPAEAKKWMGKKAKYIVVSAGTTVWIPYGHVTWIIGTSEANSYGVLCPIFNQELLKKCGILKGEVTKFVGEFLNDPSSDGEWTPYRADMLKCLGVVATPRTAVQ